MSAAPQNRVRVLVQMQKLDSVSQEEVEQYSLSVWAKLVMALPIAQKNLLKLEILTSRSGAEVGVLKEFGFSEASQTVGIWEVETYEKMEEVLNDETYLKTIIPLTAKVFDLNTMQLTPVTVSTFINNSALSTSQAENRVRLFNEVHRSDNATSEEFAAARQGGAELPFIKNNIYKIEAMYPIEGIQVGNFRSAAFNGGWSIMEAESYEKVSKAVKEVALSASTKAIDFSKTQKLPITVSTFVDK